MPMSSPIRKTSSSRRISSAIASRSASPIVRRRDGSGVDIGARLLRVGVGRGARELHGVLDRRLDLALDCRGALLNEDGAQPGDRVALLPGRFLVVCAVAARVAAAVADEAIRLALE